MASCEIVGHITVAKIDASWHLSYDQIELCIPEDCGSLLRLNYHGKNFIRKKGNY